MSGKNDLLRSTIQTGIKHSLSSLFNKNDIKVTQATLQLLQGLSPPPSPKNTDTMDTKPDYKSSTPVKPGQIIPTNQSPKTHGKENNNKVLETERDQLVTKK